MKIKKEDKIIVISGDDKGKEGIVKKVISEKGMVVVEGVNMITKHVKPQQQGQAGTILNIESPLSASKVQLLCPNNSCSSHSNSDKKDSEGTNKSRGTKIRIEIKEDGSKQRVCKYCGKSI